jgi:metallo-beta-lactamase family protein
VRLHFLGANRQVTGSRYLLEAGGLTLLIDCGMFQEHPFLERNRAHLPVPVGQVDHLLLTHAHLDHCGLIPKIVRDGFAAPILATSASIELTRIVLEDSAKIQEEDAAYANKVYARNSATGPPPEPPLYVSDDARGAFALFQEVPFDERISLNDHVSVVYRFAGHILGSASIEVTCTEAGRARTIVFSGDLGQWDRPLLNDPSPFPNADYIVMESTYGDHNHDETADVQERLHEIITNTMQRGGNVIMPTFALDRPQEVMFYLNRLIEDQRVPPLLVFLDSPMAVDVHRVFAKHSAELDAQTQALLAAGDDPLEFPGLKLTRSQARASSWPARACAQAVASNTT